MILGGFSLGIGMFLAGWFAARPAGKAVAVSAPESSLMTSRKVTISGREVQVFGGDTVLGRTSGSWAYGVQGKPALLGWPQTGRYPVLDVPPGWVVAWIEGQDVVAIGDPSSAGEGGKNVVLPARPVRGALVVPKTLGVKPGDRIGGAW